MTPERVERLNFIRSDRIAGPSGPLQARFVPNALAPTGTTGYLLDGYLSHNRKAQRAKREVPGFGVEYVVDVFLPQDTSARHEH